ncbi:hypothetical protein V1294_006294 [Bradyrhizobium sp. AZCC 1678]|uniref:hypothetical protein n=1 Tax=Bradyrhizobium sp. AZCC 1678 TaxID=3117030 RepID=UPI002FF05493
MQTASRRARLDREGRAFFPPNAAELDQARRILASPLCWIVAEEVAEHRERWIRLLLAIQTIVPRYIIAVELNDSDSAEEGLRNWSEELQQTLEPNDLSADFRSTLELIRKHPRHGGMTELEEAELTDGQGRALSAHRTQQSYIGYAKRTQKRVLAATRKRHAHRLANEMATDVQNEQQKTVQNEQQNKAV